ncbi:MAG: hypothetical protein AAB489_04265 [Patescibacteria group bacterium]
MADVLKRVSPSFVQNRFVIEVSDAAPFPAEGLDIFVSHGGQYTTSALQCEDFSGEGTFAP